MSYFSLLIIATILVVNVAMTKSLAVDKPVESLTESEIQTRDNGAVKSRVKRAPNLFGCWWVGDYWTLAYYCDSPSLNNRAFLIWYWLNGISDCNTYCINTRGFSYGFCGGANYGTTTWCLWGQACFCRV